MRPCNQQLPRTTISSQMLYSSNRPLLKQFILLPENGLSQIAPSAAPGVLVRPSGNIPILHRQINQQPQSTVVGPILHSNVQFQGASKLNSFLKQLIDLSKKSVTPETHIELIHLIQQLIDRKITPSEFCIQLQSKLHSNPSTARGEINSLIEDNIDFLRCELFYGRLQVPCASIMQPKREIINDLLNIHQHGFSTINTPQSRHFVGTSALISPASASSTRFPCNDPAIMQRFTTISSTSSVTSVNNSRALYSVATAGTIVSTPSSAHTKLLIGNPSLIQHQRIVASNVGAITPQSSALYRPTSSSSITSNSNTSKLHPVTVNNIQITNQRLRDSDINILLNDKPFFSVCLILERMKQSIPRGCKINLISEDSASVLAHGLYTFIRCLLLRLTILVQHRVERISEDSRLEKLETIKDQLNFLQRLDEHDLLRQSDIEKELIFKAARSRSKNEDPDQLRVKEMARRLQIQDYEREKQRLANLTALSAIGAPPKKRRLDEIPDYSSLCTSSSNIMNSHSSSTASALLANKKTSLSNSKTFSNLNLSTSFTSKNVSPTISTRIHSQNDRSQILSFSSIPKKHDVNESMVSSLVRVKRANIRDFQYILSRIHEINRTTSHFRSYWH